MSGFPRAWPVQVEYVYVLFRLEPGVELPTLHPFFCTAKEDAEKLSDELTEKTGVPWFFEKVSAPE